MNALPFQRVLEHALDGQVAVSEPRANDVAVDQWLDLEIEGQVWHLAVEHRAAVGDALASLRDRQTSLRQRLPGVVPILALPRPTKEERQRLGEHRINHMDLAGNVWIRSGGLLVNTQEAAPTPTRRPDRGRNPFSKKASLVPRVLLAHPSTDWRVRELAAEAGLSVGYSSEVLQSLVERGFAAESQAGFRLEDPVGLLVEWAGTYRWEDNRIHSFVVPLTRSERTARVHAILAAMDSPALLTLLSAIDRMLPAVEHDQVHVYVRTVTPAIEDRLRSDLYAESVSRGGNLHLLQPYYGDAAWYDAQDFDADSSVSDVQLFLDLVHYPVRGPEAATVLLRQRIGPRLGLSRGQTRGLEEGVGL